MEQEKVTWSDGDEVEGHMLAANTNESVDDDTEAHLLAANANEDAVEDEQEEDD
jgi:hypothetical protein